MEAPNIVGRRKDKGNRNAVIGKEFYGIYDSIIHDGKEQIYRPLDWRAFRYIELTIKTKNEPLSILDVTLTEIHYPFKKNYLFDLTGTTTPFKKILDVGERTLLACAHETFQDCPYYERSQFEGDTRVEALISYVNYGDGRLGKNAIEQFGWSINNEGFLSARYPTNQTYYIPNFSLYWIGMLHDYLYYVGDSTFIKKQLPISRSVLDYFFRLKNADGSMRKPDYHNFVDWSFKLGEPPFDAQGQSSLVEFHFLMALQWAADLERKVGNIEWAEKYEVEIERLKIRIKIVYYDSARQLYMDAPGNSQYSVHANAMAILTGIESSQLYERILKDTSLIQPTIYWRFYLYEALGKTKFADQYINNLQIWERMLAVGATTWPETGEFSRSECHGWGASPNYHLLKLVAGISPLAPGFAQVRIAPAIATGATLTCSHPHPAGIIKVELKRTGEKIVGKVTLPKAIEGLFYWNQQEIRLHEGLNLIDVK